MEINQAELREQYQSLTTDELVYIKVSSDLTDEAELLLDEELSRRDVSPDDYDHALKYEASRLLEIEKSAKRTRRRILIKIVLFAIGVLIGLYAWFTTPTSVVIP